MTYRESLDFTGQLDRFIQDIGGTLTEPEKSEWQTRMGELREQFRDPLNDLNKRRGEIDAYQRILALANANPTADREILVFEVKSINFETLPPNLLRLLNPAPENPEMLANSILNGRGTSLFMTALKGALDLTIRMNREMKVAIHGMRDVISRTANLYTHHDHSAVLGEIFSMVD